MLPLWPKVRQTPPALTLVSPGAMAAEVTFTRASSGTYIGPTNTLPPLTAATDVARYQGSAQRLLIEGPRTNLLLNSAALATQSVNVTSQVYILSFYGTGTITLSGASTAGPLVGTGPNARSVMSFTPTAGTITLTVTGSVSYAQLEAGTATLESSWIPTTSASASRAVDNAIWVPPANYASRGTVLIKAYLPQTSPGVDQYLVSFDSNSFSNMIALYRAASGILAFRVRNNGANAFSGSSGTVNPTAPIVVGMTWGDGVSAGMARGGTYTSTSVIPSALATVRIGAYPVAGSSLAFGEFERIAVYDYRMQASELSARLGML